MRKPIQFTSRLRLFDRLSPLVDGRLRNHIQKILTSKSKVVKDITYNFPDLIRRHYGEPTTHEGFMASIRYPATSYGTVKARV